jgi:hypothetical protein
MMKRPLPDKRPPPDRRPAPGIDKLREARERSETEKRRLLDRLKEQKASLGREREAQAAALRAKRDRFKHLDIARALAAARQLRFFDLEAEDHSRQRVLNRPSLALLGLFFRALKDRPSIAVLQWPRGMRDVSNLHAWAMLATICASPEQTAQGYKWCAAVPDFRTLYFPWRGHGTGTAQRRTLVERTELMKRNALHLTRTRFDQAECSPQLAKLHVTIGHLTHLKVRDHKLHLAHPTLGELYPVFAALGGEDAPLPFRGPVYELFGRVAYGAGLHQLNDDRSHLVQPTSAPFALFGICTRAQVKAALKHTALVKGRSPDVCILDLNPPGLSSLGPGWEKEVQSFLDLLVTLHPETPVLAVTQDIFVHRRVSQMLNKLSSNEHAPAHARIPPASHIVVRSSDDPFAADFEIGDVSAVRFQFHSAAGQGATALEALAEAARRSQNPTVAGALRYTIGTVRRTMSLPCGLAAAHDVLVEMEGQAAAEAFLERRSAGSVLASLRKQLELTADAAERQRLNDAYEAVNSAFAGFDEDTPIGSLLADIAGALSRKSSPSVIAFASGEERLLGERRICDASDVGAYIRKRFQSRFIRLSTLQDLDQELALIESEQMRNSWKRLVLVAPPRDAFAILLGRKWLPEEILVIADREFVDRIATTYLPLSSHPDLAGPQRIGSRLAVAAAAAKIEARARDVAPIDLELDSHPLATTEDHLIDMTADDDDDDQEVVEIALESGRLMRARARGLVIRYDRLAEVNPFERTMARDVARGNIIVVPNQAFVQEARAVLPVRVLAQARVAVYHTAVEAALPRLPGTTLVAKARHVVERLKALGARSVVEATVKDWLNAEEHKQVPAERLRPHAPQHWREFRAFMEVVKIPSDLAQRIWREGIEPLRIDRRRAGARMAQAFVSVLVDPHGGAGALPADVKQQVSRLRRHALDHLDGVLSVKTERRVRGDGHE